MRLRGSFQCKEARMRRFGFPALAVLLPALVLGIAAAPGSAVAQVPALRAEWWVNSPPLGPESLRGKVVLVDFWEYTCINWIRTSAYVKAWHRDYAGLGLVVVGVHTPEFEFGKFAVNVERGIRDHQLVHPVAIDNDYLIWKAFGNDAWPAKYLFDAQGKLVRRWAGEGHYDEIEAEIRRLLTMATPGIVLPEMSPEAKAFASTGQPSYRGITGETYVGTDRRERGTFTLHGSWRSRGQYVELQSGSGRIVLPFDAGEVNLVATPGRSGQSALTVLVDGKPVGAVRGADVGADGVARFDRSGMLRLVAGASRQPHVLTLETSEPGTQAYVFTFGP
jgi:hypothetical protein